jgi:hypothetical protein
MSWIEEGKNGCEMDAVMTAFDSARRICYPLSTAGTVPDEIFFETKRNYENDHGWSCGERLLLFRRAPSYCSRHCSTDFPDYPSGEHRMTA